MPDCLEDLKDWQPKSYPQHFEDSTFSDKDLAIEAYDLVPDRYRMPFENTVGCLDDAILKAISEAEAAIAAGDEKGLREAVSGAMPTIQSLQDMASSIINGVVVATAQAEVDRLFET